jgi:hypothetical protein
MKKGKDIKNVKILNDKGEEDWKLREILLDILQLPQ